MKVLLRGATEFFAPFVAADLIARGCEVATLSGHPSAFDEPVIALPGNPKETSAVTSALQSWQPEAVVDMLHENAEDARGLLDACKNRVARTVHLSSISVYGPAPICPITEETELAKSDRLSSAVVDKIAADETVLTAISEGAPAVILRLPALYGPRDAGSPEWFFVKRALDGRTRVAVPDAGLAICQRGFVQNISRAVAQAVTASKAVGNVYNLGEETLHTLAQLVRGVGRALDHNWDIYSVPGNRWNTPYDQTAFVDLRKARGHLRYRDRMIPRDGLELTLAWLCQHPRSEQWSWPGIEHPFDYDAENALIDEYGWKLDC